MLWHEFDFGAVIVVGFYSALSLEWSAALICMYRKITGVSLEISSAPRILHDFSLEETTLLSSTCVTIQVDYYPHREFLTQSALQANFQKLET